MSDYALIIVIFMLFLLVVLAWIIAKRMRKDPLIERLKNMDLDGAKMNAYEITKILRSIKTPNDEIKNEIIKRLQKYKYKKQVPEKIDNYTLGLIENFIMTSEI